MNGQAKSKWEPPALLGDVLEPKPLKSDLTPAEQNEFAELKTVVKKGWSTFLDVASAVLTINQKRLYRDEYETFDAFCKDGLGLSRPYAYSLIGCAEVNEQMSAIADIRVKPLTESQFRELIPVPEGKRVDAWRGALKLAGDKPVTAKVVRQAAAKFKTKQIGKPAKTAKPSAPSSNLKPAFQLIDDIEKLADKNHRLLAKVAALRKWLQRLDGK